MFRADVLRLLPLQKDVNGNLTGKRLVNDRDLFANHLPLHTVTLPEAGIGNRVPQSAGATLFVVYRDPTEPLTKIVLYDGASLQAPGATMTQTLRGFLQSSTNRAARMTHIVGSGGRNRTERLWFNGSPIASNPFHSDQVGFLAGPNLVQSDVQGGRLDARKRSRSWLRRRGDDEGRPFKTTSPYDCKAWAAIVFSTAVQDSDGDGLPDKLEDSLVGLKDPNGEPLPNIHAMGADSRHKDLLVEITAMKAEPGTTYGSAAAPFSPKVDHVTDMNGHNHLPAAVVFKNGWPTRTRTRPSRIPMNCLASTCIGMSVSQSGVSERRPTRILSVPSALARGGESIKEVACVPGGDATKSVNSQTSQAR